MGALFVYPTHANAKEVCVEVRDLGFDVAVYPGRFTAGESGAEAEPPNCWNADADVADQLGFPVVKTVCPLCPHRQRCQTAGYLGQLMAAKEADVVLCTHKRAEYSGLATLSAGRTYVSVHENAISLLRPQCTCMPADLLMAQSLLERLLSDPTCLDWFGDDIRVDDNGEPYHDEELAVRRDRLYKFCRHMRDIVDDMLGQVETATRLKELSQFQARPRPAGLERLLFQKARLWGFRFSANAWRFLLAAAAGELESAAVLVRRMRADLKKSVIGFRSNPPSPASVTWFSDATVPTDTLEAVLKRPVVNQTPVGLIARQHKAVQIPRDLTIDSSFASFLNLLRGVLADRPQFQRVGLITHRRLLEALDALEPAFAKRIVRTTYYRSGDERSSNEWHHQCDLILVAGTPRVPPQAVSEYLIQIGSVEAAARDVVWGELRWEGFTEAGEPVTVTGRGYHDEDWRQACRDLVRATLVQSIGRGRGILVSGCEVVVLSTEECGLPLSDAATCPMNQTETRVDAAIRELSAQNSNKPFIENIALKAAEIAARCELSVRQTQLALQSLERRGHVVRVGERRGWLPASVIEETSPVREVVPVTSSAEQRVPLGEPL